MLNAYQVIMINLRFLVLGLLLVGVLVIPVGNVFADENSFDIHIDSA